MKKRRDLIHAEQTNEKCKFHWSIFSLLLL